MASRDLSTLIAPLKDAAIRTQQCCKLHGFYLLVYCTFRSFEEQARLYRQSRRLGQIRRKEIALEALGYPELAQVLEDVGPQWGTIGRHVTGAGPGESWHQYRRAFDAVPIVAGKAEWSNSSVYWRKYGRCAVDVGLEWAGNWTTFREYPHSQMPTSISNPLRVLSRNEVMAALGYNAQWIAENES